jgi:hypothetical protein
VLTLLKKLYESGGSARTEAIAVIKEMVLPAYSFTAMNRYCLREVWQLPV